MNRVLVFCLCSWLAFGHLFAQSSSYEAVVHFRFDAYDVDSAYMNNASALAALRSRLACIDLSRIDSLVLTAYASPEGVYEHNLLLSERRVKAMAAYLLGEFPELSDKLICRPLGENWADLQQLALNDSLLSDAQRRQLLSLLDEDLNVGTKKWRMQQWDFYPALYQRYYASLRQSLSCVLYSDLPAEAYLPDLKQQVLFAQDSALFAQDSLMAALDTLPVMPLGACREEALYVRSNLLCPLMHIGLELPLGCAYSLELDYAFPWFKRKSDHKHCFQMLAWYLDFRYWLAADRRMEGHSLGLNLGVAYYDVERSFEGRQGELLSLSASYRYAHPIFNDALHLECSFALGYVFSLTRPYDVFTPGGKAYKRGYKQEWRYFGPTALELALVLPIKWRTMR